MGTNPTEADGSITKCFLNRLNVENELYGCKGGGK